MGGGGGVENRQNPLNALIEERQQFKKLPIGSEVFKSHSINYAEGPKSTHCDKISYNITSVFLLKAFRHPMGDG